MPDPTPAAAPAAPAAAPAPAPASAAAPAPAAVPPAAPAAPAPAPAAVPADSLLPAEPGAAAPAPAKLTPEQELAAARETIRKHEEAANPNNGKSWLLTDGVMGQGEKPGWFKADKYKTVAEQAAAYPELERRMGSFTGAPKDGKYEFTAPEGVEVTRDHPVLQAFDKWAAEHQLSQTGYSELLGMLVQYEASQVPDMGAIKASLGENADQRLAGVAAWAKANLDAEGYADLSAAMSGANAAAVTRVVESLIGKTRQVKMPGPGDDVPGTTGVATLTAIQAKMAEKLPDGRRRVDAEPGYRRQVEKEMADYFAQFPAGTQYQPDGWRAN